MYQSDSLAKFADAKERSLVISLSIWTNGGSSTFSLVVDTRRIVGLPGTLTNFSMMNDCVLYIKNVRSFWRVIFSESICLQ